MVFVGGLGLFCDTGANNLTLDSITARCRCRTGHLRRRTSRETAFVAVVDRLGIATVLRHLRASLSLLCGHSLRLHLQRLRSFRLVLVSNLHSLVQLVLDDLAGGRLDVVQCDRRFLRSTLRLETLTLSLSVISCSSGECLPHVGVPLIFLVDQMVRCRDVVVAIGFETSD